MTRWLVAMLLVAACHHDEAPRTCTCTPSNTATAKSLHDTAPMDGAALLARLRKHRRDVEQGKNPRAIKIDDDELRFAIADFCHPCGDWVGDRMTIEDMFPLAAVDDATSAICLGLVMRDGTIRYGDVRPAACR